MLIWPSWTICHSPWKNKQTMVLSVADIAEFALKCSALQSLFKRSCMNSRCWAEVQKKEKSASWQSFAVRTHPSTSPPAFHQLCSVSSMFRRMQDRCWAAPVSSGNTAHCSWIWEDFVCTRKKKRVSQRERLWGQRRRTYVPELQKHPTD